MTAVKLIETKSRMVVVRGWGKRKWGMQKYEKALEIGCTTL